MVKINLMKTPKSVDIGITTDCNLRCKHCSHFSSATDTKDLPTQDWLDFFKELKECSVLNVCLQGGEPFIRKDFKQIVQGIVDNNMRFDILSNGILIDDDIAAFLKDTNRCNYVQVSIDGSSPKTHDQLRGPGAFQGAIKGIKTLKRHNIRVAVRVTINKFNVHDLDEIAKLLLEDLGLNNFSTNEASHFGLCILNSESLELNTKEQELAMRKMVELNKKYDNRISATAGPLAKVKDWNRIEQLISEGKDSIPGRGKLVGCGCIFSKLSVRPDGVIVPCLMLPHLEIGKINKDKIKDVWHNSPILDSMRKRRDIPLKDFDYCKDCRYINFCTGNCPASTYNHVGKVDHPDTDCYKSFLDKGGKLPDLK